MLKVYKYVVNEDDETGVDFNSLVDFPAHVKNHIAFGKNVPKVRYQFDATAVEERRIVTGVMISANTPIYRKDEDGFEYYGLFDAQTIEVIRRKFFKKGFMHNLNENHDGTKVIAIDGAFMVDSWIVSNSDDRYSDVPQAFAKQNIQDGSWLASYKIESDELWEKVKNGTFNGFSVEGYFDTKPANVKSKNKQMKKTKKGFWSMFGIEDVDNEVKFAEATSADGTVVFYDGELAVDSAISIDVDGTMSPAPAGDYELTLSDGSVKIVTVDDNGVATSVEKFVADENEMEAVAEMMKAMVTATDARFKKMEEGFKALTAENATLKSEIEVFQKTGKFGANPKETNERERSMLSASELLKLKK